MTYDLTDHARESLRKRPTIQPEWIERVLQQPERVEPDKVDVGLEHRLGRIPEYDGRVLRVIIKKATSPFRVITVYFDRKMRRQL